MLPEPTQNAEPVLAVAGLVQRFGRIRALDGVDFCVGEDEIVGLVGPNGSGKTTLLKVIAGSIRPQAGTVRFRGRDVTGLPAYRLARLGLARCSQIVEPLVGMSVREVVTVGALFGRGGSKRGVVAAIDRADEMLAELGLQGQATRPAVTLNIADRKRLELARALAMEPRLLLLDEVMAGLTPPEADAIGEVVRRVRAGGVSVVVVEHVMRAITSLCDRAVVLRQGRILAEGAPRTVLRDPRVIEAYLGRGWVPPHSLETN
jgi:branched-chain amino acid transport system ATP-binding protein